MYHQTQDGHVGTQQQQYQLSTTSVSFNYSTSLAPMSGINDQSFHSNPYHLSPAIRPTTTQQLHSRHAPHEWHGPSRPMSRSLSPGHDRTNSGRNGSASFTPTDRSLPLKDVSPDSITDAYVVFILYCNPNFSLDVDTTTLKTNFQSPPKSDNKDFDTYRLFELIQKFDAKEIKTWGQLALDLGVEAPDVSKGQSVQKVQQYSVRLKRWMRAMHVDAFFEYLLGKQHAYFLEIPHPNDPHPASGRDGVVAEEDLAIRALDPSFRPKRGRRRNSDTEHEDGAEGTAGSHQSLFANEGAPSSAHPNKAIQFNMESFAPNDTDPWAVPSAITPQSFAPWAQRLAGPHPSIATSAPSHVRWHADPQSALTPHPMTALPTSMTAHIDNAFENEPKSAITPSARKRRKHGPAVSSAWPSANHAGAKPRGRPPASRTVQDGPFSTFPADPANEKSNAPSFAAPVASMEKQIPREERAPLHLVPPIVKRHSEGSGRPGRLSLQVPQHTGGPVRLATPPRVMVTGETSESEQSTADKSSQVRVMRPPRQTVAQPAAREIPGFAFEALKRVVATDLLMAELIGRRRRLTGDEAKRLADAVLERLNVPRADTDDSRDDIARLTAASWLGVGEQLNVPLGPASGKSKCITVTQFRIDPDGYEEIVSANDEVSGTREVFDLSWNASMGSCSGTFELKALSLTDSQQRPFDTHDIIISTWQETASRVGLDEHRIQQVKQKWPNDNYGSVTESVVNGTREDSIDWRARYRALEFGAKMAQGEMHRLRQRMIEQLLDTLMD